MGEMKKPKSHLRHYSSCPNVHSPNGKKGGGLQIQKKNYAYGSSVFNVFSSSEEASSSFLGVHRGTVDSSSGM